MQLDLGLNLGIYNEFRKALDFLSVQSSAAYSLRKLRSAYTGSAIRVRRSLDNAEADIGFSGTDLDTTALQNFVGSQNLLLHSDGLFTSPWIAGPAHTRTSNADIAPNGTTTATRITNTNSTTGNFTYQLQSTVTGQRTFSVYGKAETNRYLWIYNGISATTSYGVLFDLQNGVVVLSNTIGAVTSASSSIQSVGNGWYRCSITHTQATSAYVAVTATNNTSPTFSANNDITNCTAGTVLVWGAQLNQGILQPYSPTTTTANTANGFVTTWYDQSGNAHNATQATASNQPAIVTNGVVNTLNGRPAPLWDNVDDVMYISMSLASTSLNVFAVVDPVAPAQPDYIFDIESARRIFTANGQIYDGTTFNPSTAPITTGGARVYGFTTGPTNQIVYSNGTAVSTLTAIPDAPVGGGIGLGGRFAVGSIASLNGKMAEFTLFPSVLSTADRQTLERNQGQYFGITVS